MSVELHHVILPVGDMESAIHLFRDLLGFKMMWHMPRLGGRKMADFFAVPVFEAEVAYLQGPSGGTAVELIRFIRPVNLTTDRAGEVHSSGLSLVVRDIESTYRSLADEGWKPLSGLMEMMTPEGHPIRAFCIRTAEGVTLELFQRL